MRSIENLEQIFESDTESKQPPREPIQQITNKANLRVSQINISSKSRRSTKADIINLLTVEG